MVNQRPWQQVLTSLLVDWLSLLMVICKILDDIMKMIDYLHEKECDVVAGWRKNRQDGMILRKIPSLCANFLIRKVTGVTLKDYGCSLKVFKRDVAKNLSLYGELHRFIPVLAKIYGAKICQMPVSHHPRIHGVSKYGLGRYHWGVK